LRVVLDGSIQLSEHNIILGLNIPNYPILEPSSLETGLKIGEDQPSFTPFHAHGPDKGTRTCPVCKYGRYHGIILFVGSKPNWSEIEEWLLFLERESQKREKYLKTYFVYGNPNEYFKITRYEQLGKLGAKLEIQNTALTFVPSLHDQESETDLNMLRSDISNAVIIYKHRTIVEKMINVRPSEHNFMKIRNVLDQTKGLYFDLKEPHNH
ncbi:MAG TPA: hypothetical protein PKD85_02270, partial [Saprospiraceae bacterium]|nr:hypothetical protein [Saprospiraceae bacterium]